MLKSLWRRLSGFGRDATDERALARYFRDEGLHAELAARHAWRAGSQSRYERLTHATRAHLAA
jgi:hypothetical protein